MFFRRKPEKRVRVREVMRLRGAYLPETLAPAAAAQLAQAEARCLACIAGKLCDEALAAGDARAFSLFCPNSHYIQQLKRSSLSFP